MGLRGVEIACDIALDAMPSSAGTTAIATSAGLLGVFLLVRARWRQRSRRLMQAGHSSYWRAHASARDAGGFFGIGARPRWDGEANTGGGDGGLLHEQA